MPTVTYTFARALVHAAGMTLNERGELLLDGVVVHRMPEAFNGRLADTDFFDLIDWIRRNHPDEFMLVETYADTIRVDHLGVLGLAIKTAPTLRASIERIERYYRLVTNTAVYRLEETEGGAIMVLQRRTSDHPALDLRNECALAGFARNMRRFVRGDLELEWVSFQHECRIGCDRYSAHFGCPVHFGAERDGIALRSEMLDLPNRLGDKAISEFLTGHLEAEIGKLREDSPLQSRLLHRLAQALSSGVPQAAAIARDLGMSERTLYRRLAEEGVTYRDVLRQAQSSLAQELLRESTSSIAEIAFLTGFSEQSSFTRAFKRWVGLAPAEFRQQPQPGG